MAAAIKDRLGLDSELVKGGGGVFDVEADGKLIFSKGEAGRFPGEDEVIELLS